MLFNPALLVAPLIPGCHLDPLRGCRGFLFIILSFETVFLLPHSKSFAWEPGSF
jgi:hypothetical protein